MTVELIIIHEIIQDKKSTYTPALKKAVYKWRETHTEHYRTYANKWSNENYYKHAEKYKENARLKYREKQILSGISVKPRGRPRKMNIDLGKIEHFLENIDIEETI